MSLPGNQPRCGVCDHKLVKNGKTTAGRTRWRCKHCGASTTQTRTDTTRKAEFTAFYTWLTGKNTLNEQPLPRATFTRKTAWCWNVTPTITPTGEIHDRIMLDGTYFNGWCVLIAYTGTTVIDWQWCDHEKTIAWTTLLGRIPAPDLVIIDGGHGLKAALRNVWPDTKIQRCVFHIHQTVTTHVTKKPRLEAGRELLALTRSLSHVRSQEHATEWLAAYARWEARWDEFLRQRTYPTQGMDRPPGVRPTQAWWYTHQRLRKARNVYRRVIQDHALFQWLETRHQDANGKPAPRTTSPLEGGPNLAIKTFLRLHRGLSAQHARIGVDWLLYEHTAHPKDPWTFVTPEHWNTHQRRPIIVDDHDGPAGYDTGFSWEDGIGIQKGWAGRYRP